MKLVAQLRVALVLILVLGIGGAFLSLRNLQQSQIYIERINNSHSIYEQYLSLESHIYQLFKQYGDAIIIGDSNQRSRKKELIAEIENDTELINELITSDIGRADADQHAALQTLTQIEFAVKSLIAKLDRFSPTGTGESSSDWERLSAVLNNEIDEVLDTLIQTALIREEREVQATTRIVENAIAGQRHFTVSFALVALFAVLALVIALHNKITRPIDKLLAGVRQFGEGQFDHRVNLPGKDELAVIGSTFDVMAASVAQMNRSLTSENIDLQNAVDERTRQLSLMLEDVQRIDESRKRMIADVSHELRTPLTIIRGEADIALRGNDKPVTEYRSALEKTREAASHTARLVDDLLFVARTEAGEIRLDLNKMDLNQLVLETLELYGQQIDYTPLTTASPVVGDSGRIRQALVVLLENARHHGGKNITIGLEAGAQHYRLNVEDSGPGMSDNVKRLAFERYYRGSNAAERYSQGAGLGLPVAMSIAQAHGGSVELSDRPGGGLIATLILSAAIKTDVVA